MNFFKTTLGQSVAILFLALFVTIIGCFTFLRMPRSLFPEVNYPRVAVDITMGFAPLQTMEWGVTSVLEKQLRGVQGVRMVRSSTSRGQSSINVFLDESEDVTLAVQRVNAKLAEARALIPAGSQIAVRPITGSAFAGAEYCFTSNTKNSRDLRTFVEYEIRPMLLSVPGIFDVKPLGGDLPELSVKLDPKKLALHNLTVADIDDRLRNSNDVQFLGPLNNEGKEILAFGGKFVKSPKDIEAIVVDTSLGQPVTLKDIGHVDLANAWKVKDLDLNGQECVALDIYYQSGIDQQTASRSVSKAVQKIISESKGDYAFRSWDLNDFTDTATNAVLIDLAVGMFIIGAVTFFFLRNFGYSVVALLTMPLAAALTFLAMTYFHLSINLMTLGGLTAAIGLVVDNAVIVIEMFHHKRSEKPQATARELLEETLSAVVKPMIFGTLTIALVFAPIGLLSGISGMFFSPMATVHGSSLTISVLLALLVAPALLWISNRRPAKKDAGAHHSDDGFSKSAPVRFYSRYLSSALKHPKILALTLLAFPLLGLATLPWAKTGFLPEWDEGDMVIDFRSTVPISLNNTVEKLKPLEDYLKSVPEIDFFVRKVGTGLGDFNKPPYMGEIVMKLKENRKRSVFELRDAIGAQSAKLAPGFELDLFQILPDRIHDLSGSGKPIVLNLRATDDTQLDNASTQLRDALVKINGLDSVRIEEPEKASEALYSVDESLSRARELNPNIVNSVARFGLFSLDSSFVQLGAQSVPIRLSIDDHFKTTSLADLPLYTPRGGFERLGKMGKIEFIKNRVQSSHIDGNPIRALTAEISGRDLGSVVTDVNAMLSTVKPPGVHIELAGDYLTQQSSFKELIAAFLTGIVLIFLTSLFFSNSLKIALSLTACALAPPSVGLAGLVLFRIPLDVSSFSGLISVTGIAVANGFMAISAMRDQFRAGASEVLSVVQGMKSRLRPILMTNLAAMAGFVPIAIGLARGDEILRPFSIAIIIGLFGAIFATLFVMPLFYAGFCDDFITNS